MPKKILIVEDDPNLNQTLKVKLEKSGFEVLSAINGQEGLKLLSSGIDLALVDIVMPMIDGVEMIYKWTQTNSNNVPIVIMTNLAETAYPDYVRLVIKKSETSLEEIVTSVKEILGVN